MAQAKFLWGNSENIGNVDVVAGQFLFETDTGQAHIDTPEGRIAIVDTTKDYNLTLENDQLMWEKKTGEEILMTPIPFPTKDKIIAGSGISVYPMTLGTNSSINYNIFNTGLVGSDISNDKTQNYWTHSMTFGKSSPGGHNATATKTIPSDVVEGYFDNGVFYNDEEKTNPISEYPRTLYIDTLTGDTYRYNETNSQYELIAAAKQTWGTF